MSDNIPEGHAKGSGDRNENMMQTTPRDVGKNHLEDFSIWKAELEGVIDNEHQRIWDKLVLNIGTGAAFQRLSETLEFYRKNPDGRPSGPESTSIAGANILLNYVTNSRFMAEGLGKNRHHGYIRGAIRLANEAQMFEEYTIKCERALNPDGQGYTGQRTVKIPDCWDAAKCAKQSFIAAKVFCDVQELSPEQALSSLPDPDVQDPIPAITLLNTLKGAARTAQTIEQKQKTEESGWSERKELADAFQRFRLHFWDHKSNIQQANGIFVICHDKALGVMGYVREQVAVDDMFRAIDFRKKELQAMSVALISIANAMFENRPVPELFLFEYYSNFASIGYNSSIILPFLAVQNTATADSASSAEASN